MSIIIIMDSEDLLYNNRFISTNVGGIGDDRSNLLDYLDQIDNEKNKIEVREKVVKQEIRNNKLLESNQDNNVSFTFDDPIKYRKTVVNIDSRYRQLNNESVKNSDVSNLIWNSEVFSQTNVVTKMEIVDDIEDINGNQVTTRRIKLYNDNFDNVNKGMCIWLFDTEIIVLNPNPVTFNTNPYIVKEIIENPNQTVPPDNTIAFQLIIEKTDKGDAVTDELIPDPGKTNIKYVPNIWKFFKDSNEIEFTKKDHGLVTGDKISININSTTKLNRCGGLIRNVNGNEITVDSNVTHFLKNGDAIHLYIDDDNNDQIAILNSTIASDLTLNDDGTTTFTISGGSTSTSNSINNYWEIPPKIQDLSSKIYNSMYTRKDHNKIYVYHPNHGFKSPIDIKSVVHSIDNTAEFTINTLLKNQLENNMKVYISVENGQNISFNNNPYLISSVSQYEIIDNLDNKINYDKFQITLGVGDVFQNDATYDSINISFDDPNKISIDDYQIDVSNFQINKFETNNINDIKISKIEYFKHFNGDYGQIIEKSLDEFLEIKLDSIPDEIIFDVNDYVGQQVYVHINDTTNKYTGIYDISSQPQNNIIRFRPPLNATGDPDFQDWNDLTTADNTVYWVPPESVWLKVTVTNIDLRQFINYNDQIKLDLNIEELSPDRTYIAYNINYDAGTDTSTFDINTQLTELIIRNEESPNMSLTLVTVGGISSFEILNKHKINVINDHFYSISTISKATQSLYTGGNDILIKKLSTENILHSDIISDYPINEDQKNGFYKIIRIDDNHFKIKTSSLTKSFENKYINYNENSILNTNLNPNLFETNDSIQITYSKIVSITQGYKNQNDYTYEFGRTFQQIVQVKLISSEFPNSAFIIKEFPESLRNNKIYWVIKEDGEHIYEATISSGSYLNTNDFKFEIMDQISNVSRISDTNIKTEVSIVLDAPRNLVEFRIFSVTILSNSFSTKKGSKLLKILFANHNMQVGDTIIISNATSSGGISISVLNASSGYQIVGTEVGTITVILPVSASKNEDNKGGANIQIRKLVPFKILWDRTDSFGNILGFNNSGSTLFREPPFLEVVSNKEYNKFNDNETDLLFNFTGEKYIYLTNDILTTIDNNSKIKNGFAKIQLISVPGSFSFDSFVSTPKIFSKPLTKLSSLHFSFFDFNGNFYHFNNLDHSFSLEITEKLEEIKTKGISSRTGKTIGN